MCMFLRNELEFTWLEEDDNKRYKAWFEYVKMLGLGNRNVKIFIFKIDLELVGLSL